MMEIKKSVSADLENKRLTGFLLGLIFALSLLFTAFEYIIDDTSSDAADAEFDNLMADMELSPVRVEDDMIALAPVKQEPVTDKLRIEDEPVSDEPADISDMETPVPSGNAAGMVPFVPADDEAALSVPALSPVADENPEHFRVVRELPQFPGGAVEMMKWLTRNLKYPADAKHRNKEGKVTVQFIVTTEGTVTDIKIITHADHALDREALRVIRAMPRWKAGVQDGKPCRTMVRIPVVFKL